MTKTKSPAKPDTAKEQLVELRIPRGGDVFVSVNGRGYLLPELQTVPVPPEIAAEYHRSEAARDRFYETSRALAAGE